MQIAKNGLGTTRPNPSVGAVIVHNNKIIAEGFTSNYGSNHAEVNAVNAILDKSLLKEATIYVTLEPCSHFGKTPPCADLIVKHNFKKVVIGSLDTNSLVAGKGVERLKNAGIEVIVGVLEEECKRHHKRFFTSQNKKRPYIILKWAESQDGFIAPNHKKKQQPVWISNQYSQQIVHKLRSKEHAILVGTNTVIADNPKLNVRSWSGNNPTRVVLDKNVRLPKSLHVFDNSVKTIFIIDENTNATSKQENIVFEKIDFQNNVAKRITSILQKHKIQSLIVEGGAKTLQTFINENLWDEAMIFVGNVEFKEGVKGPKFDAQLAHQQKIKNDTLKVYIND